MIGTQKLLAIITRKKENRERLTKALRFHHFADGIAYVLWGAVDSYSNGTQPSSITTLSEIEKPALYQLGGDEKQLDDMLSETLSKGLIDAVLLCDREDSMHFPDGNTAAHLYESEEFSFLWTNVLPLKNQKWLSLQGAAFASTGNHAPQVSGSESTRIKHYKSLEEFFSKSGKNEILLLTSEDEECLLSCQNPGAYTIYRLVSEVPTICMDLEHYPDEFIYPYLARLLRPLEKYLGLLQPGQEPQPLMPYHLSSRMDKTSYSIFAQHYDSYMAHVDYKLWVRRIKTWFGESTPIKLSRILELACGTANISTHFVSEGYEVEASDGSGAMLEIADLKPQKPKLSYHNLLDPIQGKDYDLILCLFDSINYLLHSEHISALLNHACQALKQDGIFIFDISTVLNSRNYFSDLVNYTVFQDGYLVHRADYDEEERQQRSRLTFFRQVKGCYNLTQETHLQKVYRHSEMIALIETSQFKLVGIRTPESTRNLISKKLSSLDLKYPRLFYVLRKEL